MGCLRPCLSVGPGATEIAVIDVYEEDEARATLPGFDDVTGEPFLEDEDDDQLGERVRPTTRYEVKCKAKWSSSRTQLQIPTGNAPSSFLIVTMYEDNLAELGLLVDGVFGIGPNDTIVALKRGDGTVRYNFVAKGWDPLYCFEVRPGETGTRTIDVLFEQRRPAEH